MSPTEFQSNRVGQPVICFSDDVARRDFPLENCKEITTLTT